MKLDSKIRKDVYRRDGYRCALCDCTSGLQLHHYIRRSQGGTDAPWNLITLCWRCHAVAHGTALPEYGEITAAEIQQEVVEYLADLYVDLGYVWNPWATKLERWGP